MLCQARRALARASETHLSTSGRRASVVPVNLLVYSIICSGLDFTHLFIFQAILF